MDLYKLIQTCHTKIHKEKKTHKKVKTTKGTVITNVYL